MPTHQTINALFFQRDRSITNFLAGEEIILSSGVGWLSRFLGRGLESKMCNLFAV